MRASTLQPFPDLDPTFTCIKCLHLLNLTLPGYAKTSSDTDALNF